MKISYVVSYGGIDHPMSYEAPDERFFDNRDNLPKILNSLELTNEGAEIGVLHGAFSEIILKDWNGKKLYSIDPWKHFSDSNYMDDPLVSQAEQDKNHEMTRERLKPFGDRSAILRMTSEEAVQEIADEQLDFVYIDAQHQYDAIKADIALWYPKVKKGGLFGGHDFFNLDFNGKNIFGVQRAVEELCQELNTHPLVSVEDLSWFIIRS